MSLRDSLNDGHLKPHRASVREIAGLLRLADRDLADAAVAGLSADRRFAIVYNAALQLATIPLLVRGYRTRGAGHHWVTFRLLPDTMGNAEQELADYFEQCRTRRNRVDYDRVGTVRDVEVEELRCEVQAFRGMILDWLDARHPQLHPREDRRGASE